MPRPIPRIGSLFQQILFHLGGAVKYKLIRARGHQHALLHHAQLDIQNLLQMLIPQRLEHDCLVDPVHELRSKLPPRRLNRRPLNLVVEGRIDLERLGSKSEPAIHQVRHLARAQVRSHNDDALRQIHPAVVAQRQGSFVQDSQQQLPQ